MKQYRIVPKNDGSGYYAEYRYSYGSLWNSLYRTTWLGGSSSTFRTEKEARNAIDKDKEDDKRSDEEIRKAVAFREKNPIIYLD